VKTDFTKCLSSPQGFKGFGVPQNKISSSKKISVDGKQVEVKHGSVVLAAITSCTNTSNPDALIAAGLLAKKAVEKGLSVLPHIKTSLSPGSGVVTEYLNKSGLT
jgi:aconitate hydratase